MTTDEFDKELEELMRRRLDEREFVFKESHWQAARKMIDHDRKKDRKGFFIALLAFFMLVCASLAMIIGGGQEQPAYAQRGEAAAESPLLTEDRPAITNPVVMTDNHTEAPAKTAAAGVKHAYVPQQATHGAQLVPAPHHHSAPASRAPGAQKKRKRNHIQNEATATPAHQLSAANNEPASVRTSRAKRERTAAIKPQKEHANTYSSAIDPNEGPVKPQHVHDVTGIDPVVYRARTTRFRFCDTCLHADHTYLQYAASSAQENQRQFFAPEAGFTYYNPSASMLSNAGFTAGLRYYRFFGNKAGMNIGLFYSQLHQRLDDLVYDRITYTFDKNVDRTIVQTPRLDYIDLPVQLMYAVSGKQFVTAGACFSYLLNSSNRLIRQQGDKGGVVTYESGYTYAINRYDVQLSLGYSIFLPKRFIMNATYQYGLLDVSKNAAFRSSKADHNTGLRLGVAYKLSR